MLSALQLKISTPFQVQCSLGGDAYSGAALIQVNTVVQM